MDAEAGGMVDEVVLHGSTLNTDYHVKSNKCTDFVNYHKIYGTANII